jgi:hypothetical protein
MKTIVNCETGEVIERPLNEEELTQEAIDNTNYQTARTLMEAETEARAQAKALAEGKLAELGLTTDDLRALGL